MSSHPRFPSGDPSPAPSANTNTSATMPSPLPSSSVVPAGTSQNPISLPPEAASSGPPSASSNATPDSSTGQRVVPPHRLPPGPLAAAPFPQAPYTVPSTTVGAASSSSLPPPSLFSTFGASSSVHITSLQVLPPPPPLLPPPGAAHLVVPPASPQTTDVRSNGVIARASALPPRTPTPRVSHSSPSHTHAHAAIGASTSIGADSITNISALSAGTPNNSSGESAPGRHSASSTDDRPMPAFLSGLFSLNAQQPSSSSRSVNGGSASSSSSASAAASSPSGARRRGASPRGGGRRRASRRGGRPPRRRRVMSLLAAAPASSSADANSVPSLLSAAPAASSATDSSSVPSAFGGNDIPSAFCAPLHHVDSPPPQKVRKSKRAKRRQTYQESSDEEVPAAAASSSKKKRPKKKRRTGGSGDGDGSDSEGAGSDMDWAPQTSGRKSNGPRTRKGARKRRSKVESDYDSDTPLTTPRLRKKRKKSKKQRQAELEAEKRRKKRAADDFPPISEEELARDFALLGSLKFYAGFKPKESVDVADCSSESKSSEPQPAESEGSICPNVDTVVAKAGKMEVVDEEDGDDEKNPGGAKVAATAATAPKDVVFTFEQRGALEYLQKHRFIVFRPRDFKMREHESGALFEADGVYLSTTKCLKVGTADEVVEADDTSELQYHRYLRQTVLPALFPDAFVGTLSDLGCDQNALQANGDQADSNAVDYSSFFRALYRPPPNTEDFANGDSAHSDGGGDLFHPGQHRDLLPRLYGFQARAAAWAAARERTLTHSIVSTNATGGQERREDDLHAIWRHCKGEQLDFFVNPFSGLMSKQRFHKSPIFGSIIADEMGLGKTLESIQLILENQAPTALREKWAAEQSRRNEELSKFKQETAAACNGAGANGRTSDPEASGSSMKVACVCGVTDDEGYVGEWVACDECNVWFHSRCVQFSPHKSSTAAVVTQNIASEPLAEAKLEEEKVASGREVSVKVTCTPSPPPPPRPSNERFQSQPSSSANVVLPPANSPVTTPPASNDFATPSIASNVATSSANSNVATPSASSHLSHRYFCPPCTAKQPDIACKTTLVVSPKSICDQWQAEIRRHVRPGALSVFVYEGVKNGSYVSAEQLASYDVVVTTYEVLRGDLYFAQEAPNRSMRYEKKYTVTSSPLVKLKFWRIVLDECQMVESTTAQATMMTLKLQSVHRLAVTGTPINKSLDDLYGLVLFLRIEPYATKKWWDRALRGPYDLKLTGAVERFHSFFRNIMWRNSKADVRDELKVPPQTQKIVKVKFSGVEEYFYQRLHEESSNKVQSILRPILRRRNVDQDSVLPNQTTMKLLTALLRLRQSCCHPQIGGTGVYSLQKNSLTMEEILERLIARVKLERDEAARLMVMSMHAMAALSGIKQDDVAAISLYREVLQLASSEKLQIDKLQRMHAKHHLRLLLLKSLSSANSTPEGSQSSSSLSFSTDGGSDDKSVAEEVGRLDIDVKAMERDYMAEIRTTMGVKKHMFETATNKVMQSERDLKFAGGWFHAVIMQLAQRPPREQRTFLARIDERLLERSNQFKQDGFSEQEMHPIRGTFSDLRGLGLVLQNALSQVASRRAAFTAASRDLVKLSESPSREVIERSGNCRKCRQAKTGERCEHCLAETKVVQYEQRLFSARRRRAQHRVMEDESGNVEINEVANVASGRQAAEFEVVLLMLLNWHRVNFRGDPSVTELLSSAKKHVEHLDLLKKEFKATTELMTAQRQFLANLDELEMSMMKIRVAHKGERITAETSSYVVKPFEVDSRLDMHSAERVAYEKDMRGKIGRLNYLKSLHETEYKRSSIGHLAAPENKDGGDDDKSTRCPICLEADLGRATVVVPFDCGHRVCFRCGQTMVERAKKFRARTVKCFCRQRTPIDHISYVQSAGVTPPAELPRPPPTSTTEPSTASTSAENASTVKRAVAYAEAELTVSSSAAISSSSSSSASSSSSNGVTSAHTESNSSANTQDALEKIEPTPAHSNKDNGVVGRDPSASRYQNAESQSSPASGSPSSSSPSSSSPSSSSPSGSSPSYRGGGVASMNEVADVRRAAEAEADNDIHVNGSYGGKIESVVRLLKRIERLEEKTIVFSQWNQVLMLVENALNENDVRCVNASSTKVTFQEAVDRFKGIVTKKKPKRRRRSRANSRSEEAKEPPEEANGRNRPCNVLLLATRKGSRGLNLVEANHVIMVEPLLNPGLDAQAIGRVDRIGQVRPTFVYRFIVTNSIEEKIHALSNAMQQHGSFASQSFRARVAENDELRVRDFASLIAK